MSRLFATWVRLTLTVLTLAFTQHSFGATTQDDAKNSVAATRLAIVVGIAQYPNSSGLSQLLYANDDAKTVRDALKGLGFTVRTLLNENATSTAIHNAVKSLNDYAPKEDALVVFYFSGHGFAPKKDSGNPTLVAFDSTADESEIRAGVSLKSIGDELRETGIRRVLILVDACRNDPFPGKKGLAGVSFGLDDSIGVRRLLSAGPGQASYESPDLAHGIFSYFLVKGLQGDGATNGYVTADELVNYLTKSVRDYAFEHGLSQRPHQGGDWSGDFALNARPVEPATALSIADPEAAQCDARTAEDDRQRCIVELFWHRIDDAHVEKAVRLLSSTFKKQIEPQFTAAQLRLYQQGRDANGSISKPRICVKQPSPDAAVQPYYSCRVGISSRLYDEDARLEKDQGTWRILFHSEGLIETVQ